MDNRCFFTDVRALGGPCPDRRRARHEASAYGVRFQSRRLNYRHTVRHEASAAGTWLNTCRLIRRPVRRGARSGGPYGRLFPPGRDRTPAEY